jgi:hypothetical protein
VPWTFIYLFIRATQVSCARAYSFTSGTKTMLLTLYGHFRLNQRGARSSIFGLVLALATSIYALTLSSAAHANPTRYNGRWWPPAEAGSGVSIESQKDSDGRVRNGVASATLKIGTSATQRVRPIERFDITGKGYSCNANLPRENQLLPIAAKLLQNGSTQELTLDTLLIGDLSWQRAIANGTIKVTVRYCPC